jgi:gliding motility-associated-like protein
MVNNSILKYLLKALVVVLCIVGARASYAQPEICNDPAVMTPSCAAACIICDIDGFTGINNGGSVGEAPSDFCTKEVHNARWIAFMAGSTNLKIQLSVSNCQTGRGLELAIYEGIDCKNFRLISNCLGSENAVGPGESGIFQTTEPLVIGQYYYIVMDGSRADVCNWSFKVLEGSTKVSPLTVTNPIIGETLTCPNSGFWYLTPKIVGAIDYDWTLDGKYIGNGDSIYITWPTEGDFELCVTASNVCDEAEETCQTITVRELPDTEVEASICDGDTFIMQDGSIYFEEGEYTKTFTTSAQCDSNVILTLNILPHSSASFKYKFCFGDSFPWQDTLYTQAGIYGTIRVAKNGCDSTIALALEAIDCELDLTVVPTNPRCYGESNGRIEFSVINGEPPFSYDWYALSTTETGSASGVGMGDKVVIQGLESSWYSIYVYDVLGNDIAYLQELLAPDSLITILEKNNFNGVDVSCYGAADGEVRVNTRGGTIPYTYLWDNGEMEMNRDSLEAGYYAVTVTDSLGCESFMKTILEEPDSLVARVVFKDPECFLPSSGVVDITEVVGGTKPYSFSINNEYPINLTVFDNLIEGFYTVDIFDANGCIADTSCILVSPQIATVDALGDTSVFLGDTISLRVVADIDLNAGNTDWTPAATLLCDTCVMTSAIPNFSRFYLVSVVSKDDCISYDSVFVDVTPRGRIFVPSGFTPNKDGLNETFYVLGGSEILQIPLFSIYNRWGEKLFEQKNLPANKSELGWDSTYKGKQVPQGVYIWVAQVEYIDNRIFTYKGTITLIR